MEYNNEGKSIKRNTYYHNANYRKERVYYLMNLIRTGIEFELQNGGATKYDAGDN